MKQNHTLVTISVSEMCNATIMNRPLRMTPTLKSPHRRFKSLIRDHLICQNRDTKKTQSNLVYINYLTKHQETKLKTTTII